MAVLQVFITLEELDEAIQSFAILRKLAGVLRTQTGYGPYSMTEHPSEFLTRRKDVIGVYLHLADMPLPVPLSDETFLPRQLGAIQIIPGGLIKNGNAEVLLLTSFSAENRQGLACKPATWLRQLKKRVQDERGISFGVKGVNTVFGGEDTYNDIGYSTSAMELYRRGVVWKQYRDDNGEFFPISGNAA